MTTWITGYTDRSVGVVDQTYTARYAISHLLQGELVDRGRTNSFLMDAVFKEFVWRVVWSDTQPTADEDLVTKLTEVEGYVIFAHGVTGSWRIWEDLPGLVVRQNPRLVALVVDHNGFGETQFAHSRPVAEKVSPRADMLALENWLDLLDLRRKPGEKGFKTFNWVGHSMGGAALFYLREERWRYAEQTRLAIAPALLLDDDAHKAFFNTVGFGAGLVERFRFLEDIENIISHPTLRTLTDGATDAVKDEHFKVYETTPKGITARAMMMMGLNEDRPRPHYWDLMRVVLGHRDLLVGVIPMIDLLRELQVTVEQLRVVPGTHYLFSLGEQWADVHEQNRGLLIADILALHQQALQRQRTG